MVRVRVLAVVAVLALVAVSVMAVVRDLVEVLESDLDLEEEL